MQDTKDPQVQTPSEEPKTLIKRLQDFWKGKRRTGPLSGREEYAFHRDGSLRRSHVKFHGSKKERRRFSEMIRLAMEHPRPDGYGELSRDVILTAGDLILDIKQDRWVPPPVFGHSLNDLRKYTVALVRAARPR